MLRYAETAQPALPDPVKGYLRPLGIVEELMWLCDLASPFNVVMGAEIIGITTIPAWQKALDAMQLRHPLFSACIEDTEACAPHFRRVEGKPIPLRVIRGEAPFPWETEMEKEASTPFELEDAPLVRAVLFYQEQRVFFIITAYHAVADALAVARIIPEILSALAGEKLDPRPLSPVQDELLGVTRLTPEEGAYRNLPDGIRPRKPIPSRSRHAAPARIGHFRLDAEHTADLLAAARRNETTVHGALCAATALAGRAISKQWNEEPINIASSISLRKMLDMEAHFAPYVTNTMVPVAPEQVSDFWDIARFIKRELAVSQAHESIHGTLSAINQVISSGLDAQKAKDFMDNEVDPEIGPEILVANVGVLPFDTGFGALKLEAVFGPAGTGGVDEGLEVIGVTTFNGALSVVYTSYAPVPLLLAGIERELLAAIA